MRFLYQGHRILANVIQIVVYVSFVTAEFKDGMSNSIPPEEMSPTCGAKEEEEGRVLTAPTGAPPTGVNQSLSYNIVLLDNDFRRKALSFRVM